MKYPLTWAALLLVWLSACTSAVNVEQQPGTNLWSATPTSW
jgi:hypothetical protein